jgi:5-methylcytosine-specific restriction enzyme subunit McrC
MQPTKVIELTEQAAVYFAPDQFSATLAEQIWRDYPAQVAVEPPSFKTQQRWQLTAQSWVGILPIIPTLLLTLQPKTPIANVWRMLEYAYELPSLRSLLPVSEVASLAGFYERLALLLAQRVLLRSRQGLYRAYESQTDQLSHLRGRLMVADTWRRPWPTQLVCTYDQQSQDNEDNQIALWTLSCILRSKLCQGDTLATVRRAYSALAGAVTLQPYAAHHCLHRTYHRLNQEYQPIHTLCHFFLAQASPGYTRGNRVGWPFLVEMPRLYERFVAAWLHTHLHPDWRLHVQERYPISPAANLAFTIDLVLYTRTSGIARCVLDTKYKTPQAPSAEEIAQVLAYAQAKSAPEAVLIYPVDLPRPLDQQIGGVRVRTLSFPLHGDLDQAGVHLLTALLENMHNR